MARLILLTALLLGTASAASAQMTTQGSAPGSAGAGGFGTGLTGRLTGFGDADPNGPAVSGPAATGGAVAGPVSTQPFAGNFRPTGLFLVPQAGVPAANRTSLAAATATPVTTAAPAATTTRKSTVFVGGVGPRRLGVR